MVQDYEQNILSLPIELRDKPIEQNILPPPIALRDKPIEIKQINRALKAYTTSYEITMKR